MSTTSNSHLIAAAAITCAFIAGSLFGQVASATAKGAVTAAIQNQTALGPLKDANNEADAVTAAPGDVLKYAIEVRNEAAADDSGNNDMTGSALTDSLPEGLELLNNATGRQISEDLGTLKAGQKVVKEYLIKVTSDKNGAVIESKFCFTGKTGGDDKPQQGCDSAFIKVSVKRDEKPAPTPAPTQPTTPAPAAPAPVATAPTTPAAPAESAAPAGSAAASGAPLPNSGPGEALLFAGSIGGLGYVLNLLRLRRQQA